MRIRSPLPGIAQLPGTAQVSGTAQLPGAAVLAGFSVALLGGGAPGWLASVLWLAALAWVGAGVLSRRPVSLVGRDIPARALLTVTAIAGGVDRAPAHRGVLWLFGAAALTVILSEPGIKRLQPRPDVVNLAGLPPLRAGDLIGRLVPVSLAGTALTGVLAVVRVPWAIRLVPPTVQVVAGVAALAIALTAWRARPARAAALTAALIEYAPAYAVYTGRDDGGPHQVAMWLPHLERLGRPYLVITRGPAAMAALAGVTSAPVVARASWRELDSVVVPSLRAAFYVNSAATNSNFIGYRQLIHVYLGHGESDKSLSFHPSHAMFDRVFVAGRAAIDRYARHGVLMRPEAFRIVGRPQLSAITLAAGPPGPVPTVLYAPTWAGYNADTSYSSLAHGVAVVQALLAHGAVVVFRPHPFSRQRRDERGRASAVDALLRADAARTGRAHLWGPVVDRGTFADSAARSDAMVSDLSSVLVDYLASDKPMAVVASTANFGARYPITRGCYVVEADRSNLPAVLATMLGADPMRAARVEVREYYLGGLSGPAAVTAFVAAAADCLVDRQIPLPR